MDVFDTRYYKINKFSLFCHGQWVFQTDIEKRLGRCLIFFSLTTALYVQFSFLFDVWGKNLDETLECIPSLNLSIICFCQLCVYSINEDKILILLKCIKSDWKLWSSGEESQILRNYAESGRNYTLLYAGYIYFTIITFVTMSMTPIVLDIVLPLNESRPKQLVYLAKFPFDHDKNIIWILVYGCITSFYHMSVLFSTEAMLAVTTRHACGLYAIISYRLKNTLKTMESKMTDGEKNGEFIYKEMSFSIQCHNYAIMYSKILESLYSPFLFVTVGGNILTTSVVLIQTLNSLDNMAITIKFGSFAIAIIFHVFIISMLAQDLFDHSLKVFEDAYKECWYNIPIKSKKLLTLIIMQSHRPCKLTAGKIVTIDMVTFSKILKTSISYFTVLTSMRQTSPIVD